MADAVANLTAQTFRPVIAQGVTLVDFWAPWCVPCRKQAPILDQVASRVAGRAAVAKCNTDEQGDLAVAFHIQFIPTLIIFRDGEEVRRLSSVQDEETLVAAIEAALDA